MSNLRFEGNDYACIDGETVLECLTRHGANVPSSCRAGVCRSCMLRSIGAAPPAAAQGGLKPQQVVAGYFMACICRPEHNMVLGRVDDPVLTWHGATLVAREIVARDIARITIDYPAPVEVQPGQFIKIKRPDGLLRSYSVADVAAGGRKLELHVRRLRSGQMSSWLCEVAAIGSSLECSGPDGECYYLPGDQDQPLLLLGTGTGLAPLWGIVRSALRQHHRGPIHLYHGSSFPQGLYLQEELRQLQAEHSTFHYTPCVSQGGSDGFLRSGRVDAVAFEAHSNCAGYRVFLCGHPGMVGSAKRRAFLGGASLKNIYADPFVVAKSAAPVDETVLA